MKQVAMERGLRPFLVNLALVILGAILFALSFPNLLFANGLPFLAWIAYIPVFWVIRRSGFGANVFWGALYGYASYGLYNYWLSVFHPLAGLIVGSIYLVYLALLFPLLRLAILAFPKRGYIVQWVIWIAFEYLKVQGFLAYSYGITGYSQWHVLPVIQIADITGVWGVSALVVFPSAWLAAALTEPNQPRSSGMQSMPKSTTEGKEKTLYYLRATPWLIKNFFKREWLSAVVWFVLLTASLVYGFGSRIDYADARKVRIALIQHNTDPWEPSKSANPIEDYRTDFRILKRLSDEALRAHADTDLVVWSETAFVPRIYWHTTVRDDSRYWELVKELLDYLGSQTVPFVLGNDDARKDPSLNPLGDNRVDYNAAMLFEKGEMEEIYRKLHLVPFTEHFPYERQFPWIYNALINADTHFWEKGTEATVFETGGFRFSTPICFEDTFGYISRKFTANGAELIVNLSNDAWSLSVPAQMQHLSMAVFRAVENRRSMVRSTASGQTCAVDPNGRILAMAEPFTESYLDVVVPIVSPETVYTQYGDFLGMGFAWAALALLIIGLFLCIIRTIKLGKIKTKPD